MSGANPKCICFTEVLKMYPPCYTLGDQPSTLHSPEVLNYKKFLSLDTVCYS